MWLQFSHNNGASGAISSLFACLCFSNPGFNSVAGIDYLLWFRWGQGCDSTVSNAAQGICLRPCKQQKINLDPTDWSGLGISFLVYLVLFSIIPALEPDTRLFCSFLFLLHISFGRWSLTPFHQKHMVSGLDTQTKASHWLTVY